MYIDKQYIPKTQNKNQIFRYKNIKVPTPTISHNLATVPYLLFVCMLTGHFQHLEYSSNTFQK